MCPKYKTYVYDFNQKLVKLLTQRFSATLNELERIHNLTTNSLSLRDMYNLLDYEFCSKTYSLSDKRDDKFLPGFIEYDSDLWRRLIRLANVFQAMRYSSNENVKKIKNSFTLQLIFQNFDKKVKEPANPLKLMLLSAHDTNISPLMHALNLTNLECQLRKQAPDLLKELQKEEPSLFEDKDKVLQQQCYDFPKVANQIIIELYKVKETSSGSKGKKDSHFIAIRYNGEYVNVCKSNKKTCSYQEFKNRLKETLISRAKLN